MPSPRTTAKSAAWPQAVAVLVGVLFAVMGVVGFAATGIDGFVAHGNHVQLFGLAVNPLQNLLHLVVGIAGVVLSARLDRTRMFGCAMAIGYGALFGYGVLVVRLPHLDVLNLNWPANWLHLTFAVVGLVIALGPVSRRETGEA